jgi:hypothetical protein
VNVDASGNAIIDATTGLPKTHPALEWTEYSKATVKNYFLYLIGQGTFNFYDLNADNKTVVSLLPAGTKAGKESMLGYWNNGLGFDQESSFICGSRIMQTSRRSCITIGRTTGLAVM